MKNLTESVSSHLLRNAASSLVQEGERKKKDTSVIMHYTIMPTAENRKLLHCLTVPPTITKSTPQGQKKGEFLSLDASA